jgi:hypothetical protein
VRSPTCGHQRSTLSQLATHLLEWALPAPDGTTVVRANHQQLADATGTAREVVPRALASMRDCGLVATRRGAVAILDPNALSRIADGDEPHGAQRPGVWPAAGETGQPRPAPPVPPG